MGGGSPARPEVHIHFWNVVSPMSFPYVVLSLLLSLKMRYPVGVGFFLVGSHELRVQLGDVQFSPRLFLFVTEEPLAFFFSGGWSQGAEPSGNNRLGLFPRGTTLVFFYWNPGEETSLKTPSTRFFLIGGPRGGGFPGLLQTTQGHVLKAFPFPPSWSFPFPPRELFLHISPWDGPPIVYPLPVSFGFFPRYNRENLPETGPPFVGFFPTGTFMTFLRRAPGFVCPGGTLSSVPNFFLPRSSFTSQYFPFPFSPQASLLTGHLKSSSFFQGRSLFFFKKVLLLPGAVVLQHPGSFLPFRWASCCITFFSNGAQMSPSPTLLPRGRLAGPLPHLKRLQPSSTKSDSPPSQCRNPTFKRTFSLITPSILLFL